MHRLDGTGIVDGHDISPEDQRDTWLGVTLILTSAVAWSTMGLFVRMAPDAGVWSVVFWRSIFGGLSIIALAMIERKRFIFDWRRTMTPAGAAITILIATGIFSAIYSMRTPEATG